VTDGVGAKVGSRGNKKHEHDRKRHIARRLAFD
jgi:hypothetical protein